MIDKLKDLYYEYYNPFMTWYNAADEITQIAVVVSVSLAVFFLLGLIFLSKLTT